MCGGPAVLSVGSMTRARSLWSPPMLVALLALVVSLAGVSYAAVTLPKNSVGAKQLKKNAVSAKKVKDGSLRASDFAAGQLPAGPTGATGPRGERGEQGLAGTPGSNAFAMISARADLPANARFVSLDGSLVDTLDADVETLSPNVVTTARNLVVELADPIPAGTRARIFGLSVNGTSTTFRCVVAVGASSCTNGAGSVVIPAGAELCILAAFDSDSGPANAPAVVARWGFTIGS